MSIQTRAAALFVWWFATPSARESRPSGLQKLVRRHNNVHDQCASESVLSLVTESSASSWTRSPRREAGPAAGRELLGDARDTRARGATLPQQKSVQTPSPIQSRRQSRGHEQERTRRRRRAASPRSALAPARSSASAESARYHKKTSNSALDAPAGCRSTSWQRFSLPQDVRRTSGW